VKPPGSWPPITALARGIFLDQNYSDNIPAIETQNQSANKTDQYFETNEALLEPLLERMDCC
jgi:hypothetical protein